MKQKDRGKKGEKRKFGKRNKNDMMKLGGITKKEKVFLTFARKRAKKGCVGGEGESRKRGTQPQEERREKKRGAGGTAGRGRRKEKPQRGEAKKKEGKQQMAKKIERADVIAALGKLAFAKPNRAVELAFSEAPTKQMIRGMDLAALAEFRRVSNGTVELKFIDRVKALEALYAMLGSGADGEETEAFFRALEEAAEEDGERRW